MAMFHDEVSLQLESGKGGDGSVSFRREKYIPKGGPDGGDGGKGGDVYIVGSKQTHALNHLASVRELQAEDGIAGQGRKLYGRKGEDLTVTVPLGTRVYRQVHDQWKLVADIVEPNRPFKILEGGKGGRGNVHFATATHQTPRYAEPGEPGVRAQFKLELQLIADVGIIGLPNAGKSTFLSVLSQAKPKVADYPFTTLSPVLGVVAHYDRTFIMADIPGLIEGAAKGKGLGHKFLRHVQRTKVLLHLIDALSQDYAQDYLTVRNELAQFDPLLVQKPEVVALAKSELLAPDQRAAYTLKVKSLKKIIHSPSVLYKSEAFSAVTRENVAELLDTIADYVV